MNICLHVRGGSQRNGIYKKKRCIYSYLFKFQSPSKYFPFDELHPPRCFYPCSKQFLNSSILTPFSVLSFFVSPLLHLHIGKMFPFEDFFFIRDKKVARGETGWIGRLGQGGHAIFYQKLPSTQSGVGRWAHESPIRKWAHEVKESSKKKPHWSQMQPLTPPPAGTLIDGTPTDGCLEHSPSEGSLYYNGLAFWNIILGVFLGPSLNINIVSYLTW